jgi:hypothetical protein
MLLDDVQSMMSSAKPAQIVIRLGSQMRRHPLIPIGSVQNQPVRLRHQKVSAPATAPIAVCFFVFFEVCKAQTSGSAGRRDADF